MVFLTLNTGVLIKADQKSLLSKLTTVTTKKYFVYIHKSVI